MTRAFTLVELLVVLFVVAILLAITIPSLACVGIAAGNTRDSSMLRSHGQAFATYSAANRDSMPHFARIGFESTLVASGDFKARISYFDMHQTWHIFLADAYYGIPASDRSFFPNGYPLASDSAWPIHTGFAFGCAFVAESTYWNPITRSGTNQWRGTSLASIAFPSNKALLSRTWMREAARSSRSMHETRMSAATDGSCRLLDSLDLHNGYPGGDGYFLRDSGAVHFVDTPSMLHTINGVHGLDW